MISCGKEAKKIAESRGQWHLDTDDAVAISLLTLRVLADALKALSN